MPQAYSVLSTDIQRVLRFLWPLYHIQCATQCRQQKYNLDHCK